MLVSATNLLWHAARENAPVDPELIERALAAAESGRVSGEKDIRRCDVHAALACYRASRGQFSEARAACKEIAKHVKRSHPISSIGGSLNALGVFLLERGQFAAALEQALWAAGVFEQQGWHEERARSLVLACAATLDRCIAHPGERACVEQFLACSEQLGSALARTPQLKTELSVWTDSIWDNTESLWQQLADRGNHRVALKAYRAVRQWAPSRRTAAWDRLDSAAHRLNLRVIADHARAGALRRQGWVSIDRTDRAKIGISTEYRACAGEHPIFCVIPLYGLDSVRTDEAIEVVAGAAVFEIAPGSSVLVAGEDGAALSGNGRGLFSRTPCALWRASATAASLPCYASFCRAR